ncbi:MULTISPECIES: hypothetical protein [Curtobacterium]|uniref:hypothetical protein n=1 Tax=Curtobacterium TaxID=2034 RepID=UPI0004890491|nr:MULTISPECIES: hypothetical protein [Curtobacterium]MBT1631396.1 hypothetical protein [Curtobacterium flaccumfaciens pv. oortii]MCE0456349.1 hypothetical protein [Curtobacterium allii]MCS5505187.1 hypothetical protein [Curtobacterium flaccumfaciens pv. flaccumfaciens]MCX2844483.1 hypothetical protein [Curtobacterium flaccumfaciens pv. oortii]QKS86139.1 hypothetical protein FK523_00355 [Curtobacterium flaccumfaciens pv. flaccumfaciens]
MTDLLGLAAIVPASAGACCTVGAWRPGRAVDVVAAVAMVAAMVDGAFGPRVLPGVLWFLVLAFLAVVVAGVHRLQSTSAWRRGSAQPPGAASAHGRYGRLHAALGLLVMGATGVGMAHDAGAAGMHQHLGVVAVTWQVVLGGLTLGYLVLTVHMLRDGVRRRSRALPLVETLAMGVAVAVMSAAMV